MTRVPKAGELSGWLAGAGFVAAEDEAEELIAHAAGDSVILTASIERRLTGEPLAWITGRVSFCGIDVRVDAGVYVPRWQSEPLAQRAASRLPASGTAVDLCTGSGAVAKVLKVRRPGARVIATDIDERAVSCAVGNSIEVYRGDLFAPLNPELEGHVDVITGIVPYVPSRALHLLPRDTLTFEPPLFYDGGTTGTTVLRRIISESPRFLRPGGALLLELGAEQGDELASVLAEHGFGTTAAFADHEGDIRGIEATWLPLGSGA